jgi:regulatory protein YycI of two-component signal transduction system YycFG
MKRKIELINGESYRPNEILVDGVVFSMEEYKNTYGYNWQSSAGGNILFYRSKDGENISVKQSFLRDLKTKNEV